MMNVKHGIRIHGEFPALTDAFQGDVLVLGAGFDLWKEYDAARTISPGADIMAVNNSLIGLEYQIRTEQIKIKHWVSGHPEHFWFGDIWMKDMAITHGVVPYPKTQVVWPLNTDGSSGLLATKIALLLGYSRIIICGIPIDDTRRFYDHPDTVYHMADPAVKLSWLDFKGAIGDEGKKIQAMSGYPKELFGGPK